MTSFRAIKLALIPVLTVAGLLWLHHGQPFRLQVSDTIVIFVALVIMADNLPRKSSWRS
jgi:hypothetical protein